LPDTQVSSVFIRQQIESGNETGAAAVSVVLLLASLLCLLVVSLIQRWGSRHDRSSGSGVTNMPMSGFPFDPAVSSLGSDKPKEKDEDERE